MPSGPCDTLSTVRVLVVEDDPSIARALVSGLGRHGFEPTLVTTGAAAVDQAVDHDLVVLDLGLPDLDGTEVCRRIRATSEVPIIVASARSEEIDRVVLLESGADDYVVKPFGLRELVARIRAVTRRGGTSAAPQPEVSTVGDLSIDERRRSVSVGGEEVRLTAREFDLLAYLARDPGTVARRSDILHDVWDPHWFGSAKTLDVHVASVRRKLGHPEWIEAVRGVGFRLVEHPVLGSGDPAEEAGPAGSDRP